MTEYQKAVTKYVRISARKARLAADIIRGLNVEKALVQLRVSPLKAAKLLIKTLESAIANAVMQMEVKRENLKIVEVKIDVGPTLKRAVPRSRGSKNPILRRSSHFTVIVGEE